jgi:hypothetical protein
MKRLIACSLLALATGLSPAAFAQPTDPAAAESLFRAGREAADKGDLATARAKFIESQRLDPAPGTLINIADCEERLGLVASAWEHFVTAAEQLAKNDDRIPWVMGRIAALEKRLPRLTVKLAPGAPPGTKVVRGGVEMRDAALGVAVPVDPGLIEVVLVSPGRERRSTTVLLHEGERKELVLEPGPEAPQPWPTLQAEKESPAPASQAVAPAETGSADSRRTLGFAIGGAGIASLAVGTVTGIMAFGAASTFKADCDASGACRTQQGVDAAASGKTLATLSTVSFLVGLAGVGGGAYFLLTGDGKAKPTTALAPVAAPAGAGLSFRASF